MNALRKIRKGIDKTNLIVGTIAKYLLLAILFALCFEVISRYIFNNPTIWAQDMSRQILCTLGALGGGYTLLFNQHVRVDVFWGGWSPRTRGIVDMCTCVLFLIFVFILFYQSIIMAQDSWMYLERAATVFAPPLYYIKSIIPVGVFLLIIQGIAKIIHDIIAIITGESEDWQVIE